MCLCKHCHPHCQLAISLIPILFLHLISVPYIHSCIFSFLCLLSTFFLFSVQATFLSQNMLPISFSSSRQFHELFFFLLFVCFICVIHYVFPSLLLRVYSANAFQIVFCVFFFQHLKFVQNFEKFPSLTISVLLSLHFTCCVSLFPLILPPYQVKCLCIQLMFLLYFHKSHPVISNRFNRKL